MSSRERVSHLPIGTPLTFDIVGSKGEILFSSGTILTKDDVDSILDRGLFGSKGGASSEEALLEDESVGYDSSLLQWVSNCLDSASEAMEDFVKHFQARQPINLSNLDFVIEDLQQAISNDIAAVLSQWGLRLDVHSTVQQKELMERSVKLSCLGSVIANYLGLSQSECRTVALSGFLHDLSLIIDAGEGSKSKLESSSSRIYEHPLRSAEMIGTISAIPLLVRIVVSQVHEQMDGSGYPRHLRAHQLNPLARILNLADAYLALVEPMYGQVAYLPSDALAYLVYHGIQGKFDRECLRALVGSASIYAIGSAVILDDATVATVVRSNASDPGNPIVRIDTPEVRYIDTSRSKNHIHQPAAITTGPRRRLLRRQLDDVLWLHPLLSQIE